MSLPGESLFALAIDMAGLQMSWLELVAVGVSLAMVACNIREVHWGWPLAIASSAMYLVLFWHTHLYGSAALQGVFIAAAFWGWWQWLRPSGGLQAPEDTASGRLTVSALSPGQWVPVVVVWGALWLGIGALMQQSDSPAPWWDAYVTAGSLVGQYLLGRKRLQNWNVWLIVNVCSVALFASQGLWPTAALYAVFALLSVAGWRVWRARLTQPMEAPSA